MDLVVLSLCIFRLGDTLVRSCAALSFYAECAPLTECDVSSHVLIPFLLCGLLDCLWFFYYSLSSRKSSKRGRSLTPRASTLKIASHAILSGLLFGTSIPPDCVLSTFRPHPPPGCRACNVRKGSHPHSSDCPSSFLRSCSLRSL